MRCGICTGIWRLNWLPCCIVMYRSMYRSVWRTVITHESDGRRKILELESPSLFLNAFFEVCLIVRVCRAERLKGNHHCRAPLPAQRSRNRRWLSDSHNPRSCKSFWTPQGPTRLKILATKAASRTCFALPIAFLHLHLRSATRLTATAASWNRPRST